MSKAIDEFKKLLVEASKKKKEGDSIVESPPILSENVVLNEEESIAQKTARYLNIDNSSIPAKPEDIEGQRWNDPITPLDQKFVTFKEMNDHYSLFIQRIQKQISTMGGSGEVNFRNLDDVNRSTLSPSTDNWILEYNATSKKVQFTNQLGPVDRINFDVNHVHDEVRLPGTLCWSQDDDTLNIEHPGGVTQQVGQELYAYIRNRTGSTIPNGTAVQFSGAEQNGTARLLIAPMIADGSFPSLYGLGIATQDILDGQDGKVTVWGKVRDLDTSAWEVGDILYVSPFLAGGLTNVKPTAPNNVIPIAAVLRKNAVDGEIFVRPTIEQQQMYGRFARTTSQTAAVINTPYTIEFDDTEITNGVIIGTPTSRIVVSESGFYQFDLSIEAEATSNKGIIYLWFRKNGVDIPMSSRSNTVTNGDRFAISTSIQISLNANDYVEAVWAISAIGIVLRADATPVVGPSVASALLSVAQIQL